MIKVSNLSFTYPTGDKKTIKDISFNIPKGEVFGFLGPSGAGKSTVQKILIGILKGYEGSVNVMGEEIKVVGSDFYEEVGISFEHPNLYPKLTAKENLDFFGSLYKDSTSNVEELLEMVGLENFADKRTGDFSKGMKNRLSFCRAFLNKPKLLFLDEPTSGLDPENARKIKNIILSCKAEGKTVFLTTHDMKVAEDICDMVGFIVDGEIVLIDSPRRLKLARGKKIVRVEYREECGEGIKVKDFSLKEIANSQEFYELNKKKDVETIHTLEPSLDDIFIEVTGRSLK
ncbi:Fluoroquinolones export ATP-binding protein [Natranaerofaba carboxydovora]|nr:Fluoroquinolones export ATP-binding protein [Natranaerofaba carboxydovora]